MATGRSCLRAFLQPALPLPSHAAASGLAATSDAARTTLRPASPAIITYTHSSAARSSASTAAAADPDSSRCTSARLWYASTVVTRFGWDSLAPMPSTARASSWATGSSASTTAAAAPRASSPTPAAASPGSSGCATAPSSSATGSSARTCPALVRSDPHVVPLATRTPTAGFGWTSTAGSAPAYRVPWRLFSSSAPSGDSEPPPSLEEDDEPEDRSWANKDPPMATDAYFIVIGHVLKTVNFSDDELRYLSGILAKRLQKHTKSVDTSLAEKVEKIVKAQDQQGERIDGLLNATLTKQKEETEKMNGSQDLPKIGSLIIRMWTSGGA